MHSFLQNVLPFQNLLEIGSDLHPGVGVACAAETTRTLPKKTLRVSSTMWPIPKRRSALLRRSYRGQLEPKRCGQPCGRHGRCSTNLALAADVRSGDQ